VVKSLRPLLTFNWQPVWLVLALFSARWSAKRETSASVCQGTEDMSNLEYLNTPSRVGIGTIKHKRGQKLLIFVSGYLHVTVLYQNNVNCYT